MYSGEVFDVGEPSAEELICPAIGFQDTQGKQRVVVDGVDHHLHKVDAIGFDLKVTVVQDSHSDLDEIGYVLVDMAPKVEHDGFRQLATAYPFHCPDFLIKEDILDHTDYSLNICWILDHHVSTVRHEVVQCR